MNTFYTHRRAKSADVGALSLAMSSASAGASGPFDQTASGWGWAGTDEEPIECVDSAPLSLVMSLTVLACRTHFAELLCDMHFRTISIVDGGSFDL
jgi:hypothetical protein